MLRQTANGLTPNWTCGFARRIPPTSSRIRVSMLSRRHAALSVNPDP